MSNLDKLQEVNLAAASIREEIKEIYDSFDEETKEKLSYIERLKSHLQGVNSFRLEIELNQ